MPEVKPMPKSFPWLYFFLNFGQMFGLGVAMYLQFFLTEYAGINPVTLALILTVSRVVDLVTSIIAGPIVQKSNGKQGQFRSWFIPCVLLVQIGCWMMFANPPLPMGAKLGVIAVGYILQNAPMNFLATANMGLMAKVAGPSMENRMELSAKTMQGMNAANILVSAMTLPLINMLWTSGLNGHFLMSIAYGMIMICAFLLVFVKTKPYDEYDPNFKAAAGPTVGQIYGDLLKNPMIWVLLFINVLAMTSFMVIGGIGLYYYQFSVNQINMQPVAMTIMSIVSLAASFIMAPVSRKIGKKNSAILSTGIAVCVQISIGMFAHENVWFYIVMLAVNGFGAAILGVVGVNFWLDSAEYQLYKTGIDTRPTAMSMMNIPMKVGMVLAGPITAWILTTSGYAQEFTDAGLVTSMSNPALFVKLMGFFPAIISGINCLTWLFGYKITDAKAAEYAAANQKSMMDKMAAAAAASGEIE